MQKRLAIGQGAKILDKKSRGGGGVNESSPRASLRVKLGQTYMQVSASFDFQNLHSICASLGYRRRSGTETCVQA